MLLFVLYLGFFILGSIAFSFVSLIGDDVFDKTFNSLKNIVIYALPMLIFFKLSLSFRIMFIQKNFNKWILKNITLIILANIVFSFIPYIIFVFFNTTRLEFQPRTIETLPELNLLNIINSIFPSNIIDIFKYESSWLTWMFFMTITIGFNLSKKGTHFDAIENLFIYFNKLFLNINKFAVYLFSFVIGLGASNLVSKYSKLISDNYSLSSINIIILISLSIILVISFLYSITIRRKSGLFIFLYTYSPALLSSFVTASRLCALPIQIEINKNNAKNTTYISYLSFYNLFLKCGTTFIIAVSSTLIIDSYYNTLNYSLFDYFNIYLYSFILTLITPIYSTFFTIYTSIYIILSIDNNLFKESFIAIVPYLFILSALAASIDIAVSSLLNEFSFRYYNKKNYIN